MILNVNVTFIATAYRVLQTRSVQIYFYCIGSSFSSSPIPIAPILPTATPPLLFKHWCNTHDDAEHNLIDIHVVHSHPYLQRFIDYTF